MWPEDELTHHPPKGKFSCLSADISKKWISVGRLSRMRGGVSLPRSIGESNPLLMFHSSLSLFHVFTFFFLYQVFLHLTLPESQKMLTNSCLGDSSIFICTASKKKKTATSSSPTPPLKHFVSPTLWQSFALWVIESLMLPTLSWGTLWPGTSLPSIPLL